MKLKFLGTGDARSVPVYGCRCRACQRAMDDQHFRRKACSVVLECEGGQAQLLIDAGCPDLPELFPPGTLSTIFLTHYHMDHVAGLFPLRWGVNCSIAVYGPDDEQGCDDLFKHPGILDFKPPLLPFETAFISGFSITPVPLRHSRPCLGYCIEAADRRLAYLTDTVGLPQDTIDFLQRWKPHVIVLDCTHPPSPTTPRNHNDWNQALATIKLLSPEATLLTHIGHDMDAWLMDNALPENIFVATDTLEWIA